MDDVEEIADALAKHVGTIKLCWSRGPRIGDNGVPYCKLLFDHEGYHQASTEDGWYDKIEWGGPTLRRPPEGEL